VLLLVALLRRSSSPIGKKQEQQLSSWQQQTLGKQRERSPPVLSLRPPPPQKPRPPPSTTATTTTTTKASTSTSTSATTPPLPASFAAVRSAAPRQTPVLDDRSVRCRVGKVCEGWRACPAKKGGERAAAALSTTTAENPESRDADDEDPLGCVSSPRDRANFVRAAIKDSWEAYARSAFGADELAPLSNSSLAWFDLGLTLVDALDTLLVSGLHDEYQKARAWVGAGAADGTQQKRDLSGNLPSSSNSPPAGSKEAGGLALDPDKEVNLFETTIRVLGGLLSAAHLEPRWLKKNGKSKNDRESSLGGMALPLLSAAAQLGIRLSPALDGVGGIEIVSEERRKRQRRRRRRRRKENKKAALSSAAAASRASSSPPPPKAKGEETRKKEKRLRKVPLSDVSLRRLEAAGPAWTSFSSLSEATTLSMEFSFLSRATTRGGGRSEDGGFEESNDDDDDDDDGLLRAASAATLSAARAVASSASSLDPPSLPPIYVDPDSGHFSSGVITLGARGDSYYEYLLKQWLLGGKKERETRKSLASSAAAASTSTVGGDKNGELLENFDDAADDDGLWMRDAFVDSMRSLRARLVARAPLPSTHPSEAEEEKEKKKKSFGGSGERARENGNENESVSALQRRRGGLAYIREVINGADSPKMDHLVCFLPGLLALGAAHGVDTRRRVEGFSSSSTTTSSSSSTTTTTTTTKTATTRTKDENPSSSSLFHPDDDDDVSLSAQLALTCAEMYRGVPAGLAPEIVHFREREKKEVIPLSGVGSTTKTAAAENPETPEIGHGSFDVKPADAHNLLRSEAVESWFILWRLTGDEAYREWGWAAFRAWEKFSRVRGGSNGGGSGTSDGDGKSHSSSSLGFANLDSVLEVPPRHRDKMESFWVAETLKYLYLMFDDEAAARLPLVRRFFF